MFFYVLFKQFFFFFTATERFILTDYVGSTFTTFLQLSFTMHLFTIRFMKNLGHTCSHCPAHIYIYIYTTLTKPPFYLHNVYNINYRYQYLPYSSTVELFVIYIIQCKYIYQRVIKYFQSLKTEPKLKMHQTGV